MEKRYDAAHRSSRQRPETMLDMSAEIADSPDPGVRKAELAELTELGNYLREQGEWVLGMTDSIRREK
jgi:hypothetical protein